MQDPIMNMKIHISNVIIILHKNIYKSKFRLLVPQASHQYVEKEKLHYRQCIFLQQSIDGFVNHKTSKHGLYCDHQLDKHLYLVLTPSHKHPHPPRNSLSVTLKVCK